MRALRLFALSLLAATALAAQPFPSLERGFDADKMYQFGNIDSINLMNGNVVLTIPIGSSYPVGGGLSYDLKLIYNAKAWDFQETYYQGEPESQAIPDRQSNAGMGWSLSLGKLLSPDDPANDYGTSQWVYISPDGAEHVFYQGLQTVGSPLVDYCATACYTRDGSYIRMTAVSSTQKVVEYPDGSRHTFTRATLSDGSVEWRITQIRDRFEDGVRDLDITYSLDSNTWTLTDKHGRQQKVIFGADPSGRYKRLVQRVELTSFGTGSPAAVYTFSYLPPQNVAVPCSSTLPGWNSVSVPLLSSLFLPDGSSYGFTYWHPTDGGDCRARGIINTVHLPTQGKISYSYRLHALPVKGCSFRSWHSYTVGIATRRMLDAAGNDAGTWTYSSALSQPPASPNYVCDDGTTPYSAPSEELQVTVVPPLRDRFVHYFSVYPGSEFPLTSSFDERDYGLPFSKLPAADATGTRFLSTQSYNCDAAGANCTLLRSTYVRYERDADSSCPATSGPGADCLNTNRRLASQRIVFHDDGSRHADVDSSDFDGFGHYRTVATGGNFGKADVHSSFTNYNPGNQLPSASGAWVLNTYTEQSATEGGETEKTQFCFDPDTGFLKRSRTYTNGSTPGTTDVLVVQTPDASGNVMRKEWYGGDAAAQALSTSTSLCSLALPAANAYRLDHTWQYGSLQSSQYKDAAGGATGTLNFRAVDHDIDLNTGLVAVSRDTAGIATNYTYDSLGRRTAARPQATGAGWEETTYVRAVSGSRARVELRECSAASQTTCTVLSHSQIEFDDFGRPVRERRLMANGTWSKRVATFDLGGNRASVSQMQADTTADASLARTTFSNYDPFGRPGTITPPDGTGHNITYSYNGVRLQTRTSRIGTGTLDINGNVPEISVTTTRLFDRQGRLWQVREPSNASGTNVTTEYTYDAAGRIGVVRTAAPEATQFRYFNYDGRGFLTSDTHPEKNNLQARYSGYDPLGNRGREEDVAGGPNDLTYFYDRAGRLTQVRETGASGRPLKVFTYASGNGISNFRAGKLEQARRYNYVLVGTTPYTVEILETYTYGGVLGRVSRRDTQAIVNGGNQESFTQTFAWDALGNPASVGSSRCTHGVCTGAAASERSISFSYTNDFLTAVPGYATSINYHANGMVNQVAHANGVTDAQAVDTTNWLARPASISTSGVVSGLNWSTGTYRYDGNGNVTKMGTDWFQYDKVNRLIKGVIHDGQTGGGSEKQQTYTYDTYGNITQIVTTSGGATQALSTPTSVTTNRLTGAVTYDDAGNVTAWNGNTYQYDKLNRAWRTVSGSEDWHHFYTAEDERIWSYKIPANLSRWTLRGLDGKVLREYTNSGGVWSVAADYVYREGRLLAAETSAGRRHFHIDHLGTPRLITNGSGQKVAYHVYYPFGQEATAFNQDAERMKFTGHERDLGSLAGTGDDLDFMRARFFNPHVARFHAFDPVGGDPRVPQSWNRYAYVLNNPIKYVDPDGRVEGMARFSDEITVVASGIENLFWFLTGFANALQSDLLLGANRIEYNDPYYETGQVVGDLAALGVGVSEIFLGAGGEIFGFSLDLTGVGAIVGVPINIVSAGVITHGAATSLTAMSRLDEKRRKPGSLGQFKGSDAKRRENKMVRDVANELGLSRDQQKILHQELNDRGVQLDYHGVKELALELFPR